VQERATGADDRVIGLHAIEGGHALGGSLEPLETFAARGVAYLTLTHFFDKGLASAGTALPFFPDAGDDWPKRGLSGFGRDVTGAMEALGILLDVSMPVSTALVDIFATARRPFLASHASSRTLGDHPYSLAGRTSSGESPGAKG